MRHAKIRRGEAFKGKQIVICLDGTWNHPEQSRVNADGEEAVLPTNIYRISQAVAPDGPPAYYQAGLGNEQENMLMGQLFGGAFGAGAYQGVHKAYLEILRRWQPGSEIFIFGFSRGAAMARMLCEKLSSYGLPESLDLVSSPMRGSRRGRKKSFKKVGDVQHPNVRFLGLFDTVASFGIPVDIFGIPFQDINLFKDLKIGDHVEEVMHLVALDECRDAFDYTPIEIGSEHVIRSEIWMPGVHGDIGGGSNPDRRLSDLSLGVMMQTVANAGLEGKENWKEEQDFNPSALGPVLDLEIAPYREQVREMPGDSKIHTSVAYRQINLDYSPRALSSLA